MTAEEFKAEVGGRFPCGDGEMNPFEAASTLGAQDGWHPAALRGRAVGPSRHPGPPRVDFSFATATIKDICERRECAVRVLGEAAAIELERRLADIEACDNALEFGALCGEELQRVSGHRWSLHLADGIRLEVVAGHVKPRLTETGATDWGKVTRLRIESVGGSDG